MKERVATAKRERNQVLDAMMAKATADPSYKTLTRIIQVVKAVFSDKIDKDKKKGKGDEDDVMDEDDEEKKKTASQKHKKFSQSLQPEEYQRLVQFFANDVPKLALKIC